MRCKEAKSWARSLAESLANSAKRNEDNPKRCKEAGSQQAKSLAMSSAESLTMPGEERPRRNDVIIIITTSTITSITPRMIVHRIVDHHLTSSMAVEAKKSVNTHTWKTRSEHDAKWTKRRRE